MKYAYINGKILDGTKDMQVKEGFVILTDNDKIEDIVKAGTDLNGYEKVDLKRRYIMPGLINMHVHLAGNGKPQKKQRDNEKLVKILMGNALMRSIAYGMVAGFAKTELMSGVTTIRTVGGLGSFDTKLRDEINAGTKMGPRILAANEGISVPAFVLPLDRDRAIITLVDSNLQRENILPSERAFAYKMKSEAMKRQGFRTDL